MHTFPLPVRLYAANLFNTRKATEACEGFLPWSKGPYPGDWTRAETYAHDILGDLNNYAEGWTDWNAFLDEKGGPNWANNQVDAAVIIDSNTSFFKQPMCVCAALLIACHPVLAVHACPFLSSPCASMYALACHPILAAPHVLQAAVPAHRASLVRLVLGCRPAYPSG